MSNKNLYQPGQLAPIIKSIPTYHDAPVGVEVTFDKLRGVKQGDSLSRKKSPDTLRKNMSTNASSNTQNSLPKQLSTNHLGLPRLPNTTDSEFTFKPQDSGNISRKSSLRAMYTKPEAPGALPKKMSFGSLS